MYGKYWKRAFDVVLSCLGLIFLSPVFLIVSIWIKAESKGPVIFKQERLGLDGKVFEIYKFRSMHTGAEFMGSGVYSMQGDTRVTNVGKVIRRTSIDEFPQFFNILKGDMSIVGPRPVLTYHPWKFDCYTKTQKRMFCVRPGVTGWAQVNGRKDVEWNKRIELNLWYIEHLTLWLDIKILVKTVLKVFSSADNVNVEKTLAVEDVEKQSNMVGVGIDQEKKC